MMTDDMKCDPPPPPPTCVFTEIDDTVDREKPSKASIFFEKNKITRVPLIALQTDLYKVENQNWACISIIKPDEYGKLTHRDKTYKGFLIKFRGCFATKEQAVKHIEKIMQVDRHFDVHLIPCFAWASLEDTDVEDHEYLDNVVKEIVTGYFQKENQRISSFRDRIANTESSERSDEISDFFNQSASACTSVSMNHVEPQPSEPPLNLDEAADMYNVTPSGFVRNHEQIKDACVNQIVSEIILD